MMMMMMMLMMMMTMTMMISRKKKRRRIRSRKRKMRRGRKLQIVCLFFLGGWVVDHDLEQKHTSSSEDVIHKHET